MRRPRVSIRSARRIAVAWLGQVPQMGGSYECHCYTREMATLGKDVAAGLADRLGLTVCTMNWPAWDRRARRHARKRADLIAPALSSALPQSRANLRGNCHSDRGLQRRTDDGAGRSVRHTVEGSGARASEARWTESLLAANRSGARRSSMWQAVRRPGSSRNASAHGRPSAHQCRMPAVGNRSTLAPESLLVRADH
jgi:hypothetical protein